jgi:hypothetical protein
MARPGEEQDPTPTPPADDPASGSHPETDVDGKPAEPESPTPSPEGTPPEDDGAEPPEWESLQKKFENIEDEQERKRAIGKQYWEKTRYAAQVRKEKEALEQEVEDLKAQRLEQARREEPPPGEPPPPHPDIERLDSRISALSDKDEGFFKEQKEVLLSVSQVDQDIAVAKSHLESADEYQRAALETRLEGLTHRKQQLHDRFGDLKDRRDDLEYRLDDLQQQRDWTANILEQQGKDTERERQSRDSFKKEFPQEVKVAIDSLADAAGLDPEDEALRTDLYDTVKDRLTVKFWKLGQANEVDDVDVGELIESEVKRYLKAHDLEGRAKFGKRSKEKLDVAGKRRSPPPSTPKEEEGAPQPLPGYDAEPRDVTALGARNMGPSMEKGRKHLEKFGL